MIKGFRDFVLRGNVVDLAVAVVIGAAFTAIVTAITGNVLDPLLASIGSVGSPGFGFTIRPDNPATFVNIGAIITAIINFVLIAAVVYFVIVVPMNHLLEMRKRGEVPEVEATPEDIALLQEIRDILRERQGSV